MSAAEAMILSSFDLIGLAGRSRTHLAIAALNSSGTATDGGSARTPIPPWNGPPPPPTEKDCRRCCGCDGLNWRADVPVKAPGRPPLAPPAAKKSNEISCRGDCSAFQVNAVPPQKQRKAEAVGRHRAPADGVSPGALRSCHDGTGAAGVEKAVEIPPAGRGGAAAAAPPPPPPDCDTRAIFARRASAGEAVAAALPAAGACPLDDTRAMRALSSSAAPCRQRR